MKDKLKIGQHSNIVYSIPCQCGLSYIGESSRCLCERSQQHQKDVENVAKKPTKTALVKHVSLTKHQFDFNNAKILRKVRTRGLLKIHEANNIILNEDSVVNFKKDAKHVSPVVYNLIKKKMIGRKLHNQKNKNVAALHETSTESERTSESVEQMLRQEWHFKTNSHQMFMSTVRKKKHKLLKNHQIIYCDIYINIISVSYYVYKKAM